MRTAKEWNDEYLILCDKQNHLLTTNQHIEFIRMVQMDAFDTGQKFGESDKCEKHPLHDMLLDHWNIARE